MFGIGAKNKKQDSPQQPQMITDDQNGHFHVHTMSDDIKAIESGVAPQSQKIKTAPAIDALPARDAGESPFLKTTPQDIPQKTSTPKPQKSATTNPFFDHDDTPSVQSTPKTPTPIPQAPNTPPIVTPEPQDPHITLDATPPAANTHKKPSAAQAIQNAQQGTATANAAAPEKFNESAASFDAQPGVPVDPFVGTEELHITEEKSSSRRIVILITIIIATLLLVGALLFAWFWWKNTIQPANDDVVAEVENPLLPEEPIIPNSEELIQPEITSYSSDLPNYITLSSIGTDGAEVLRTQLETVRKNMDAQNTTTPVSFIVVNENETPYSFRAFAERTQIPFPVEVLENADHLFEIYAYRDQGDTRFGLAFDVRNAELVRETLRAHEGQFGIIMREFLPRGLYVDEATDFQDNIYGAFAVRYTNLTKNNIESIDYTVGEKRVYIGTTLQTLRAILEKNTDNTPEAVEEEADPIPLRKIQENTPADDGILEDDDITKVQDVASDEETAQEEVEFFGTIPLNPGQPDDAEVLDLDL